MSVTETLDNSHLYAIQTLDDLNEVEWDMPNVVGEWSVKDVVAHLASYEHLLLEILQNFTGQASDNVYITAFRKGREDDYQDTQTQTPSLLSQVPAAMVEKEGTIPVSDANPTGSLAKLVENIAVHTRIHCDQIRTFRQREKQ